MAVLVVVSLKLALLFCSFFAHTRERSDGREYNKYASVCHRFAVYQTSCKIILKIIYCIEIL